MRLLLPLLLFAIQFLNAQTFTRTQLVPNVHFGIAFDLAPDGRIFLTQKGGFTAPGENAVIKVHDANGNFLSVFYDLSDSVDAGAEHGLLGITIDPNFSTNHFVYVFYTQIANPSIPTEERLRILRLTDVNNTGQSPSVIFDYDPLPTTYSHVGGNIHFRPSDSTHLYVTIGDMMTGYSGIEPALLDNPLGKILRISKYPNGPVPTDNPFYDDGNPYTGNCDWIWSYGHRNAFDFCFGPNDSLYCTENGTSTFDEVNLITKGGFYGWPYCEGSVDGDTTTIPCHDPNSILPFAEFGFPLPSLTGIVFYMDTLWNGQQNHLIVGDFNHSDLAQIYLNNPPAYDVVDSTVDWIDDPSTNGITTVMQGPEGCIYVMEIGDSTTGGIFKICPFGTDIHELTPGSMITIAPNPSLGATTVRYNLLTDDRIKIELYDFSGRIITTIIDETQTSGTHSVELVAQDFALSPGVYTCVLRGEYVNSAIKFIVQ